jgi:hypothetical protein
LAQATSPKERLAIEEAWMQSIAQTSQTDQLFNQELVARLTADIAALRTMIAEQERKERQRQQEQQGATTEPTPHRAVARTTSRSAMFQEQLEAQARYEETHDVSVPLRRDYVTPTATATPVPTK